MPENFQSNPTADVRRLTALWGFSEAAFGGILHALKIPFTGMLLGSAAIIFISLIANASKDKTAVLKSTLIVILIKAFVSPYSSITSYFAVLLQGVFGYILFSNIKSQRSAAIMLGFFTMFFSALQKLIVITILFGNSFWESIDVFVNYVLKQIGIQNINPSLSISLFIVLLYAGIHIFTGIFVGLKIVDIPAWLQKEYGYIDSQYIFSIKTDDYFPSTSKPKTKRWWKRKSGIFMLVVFGIIAALSFLYPDAFEGLGTTIIVMVVRSILITLIWYFIISPFLLKHFKKVVEKKNFKYASQINKATELFPDFKKVINFSWKESSKLKGIYRIRKFLLHSLALLLIIEIGER